ncbi:CotO family spore coat protein [Oceanobacillus profundus]|uniref:CotO family spore coat protein n=1 Tax=Oceanobacillus TaxID=182709 RepID=UPI0026E2F35A|nr:CotO family spore coat protein [Oceanobacillus profundus]MDO6449232.1 CotO family spore coat protein [Oceanobacillus profundus]
MSKKKFANEPLLYIHQPTIGTTKAPMQHSYMSERKTKQNQSSPEVIHSPKRVNRRHHAFLQEETTEELEETTGANVQDSEEQQEIEFSSPRERRKQFKEMNTQERIDYFLTRPKFAPQVRCEIKTKEKTYRGIVLGKNEEEVVFKTGNRSAPIQIAIDEITEVQLLGF